MENVTLTLSVTEARALTLLIAAAQRRAKESTAFRASEVEVVACKLETAFRAVVNSFEV